MNYKNQMITNAVGLAYCLIYICTAEDIAGSLGSTVTLPCQYTNVHASQFVVWSYIYSNGTLKDYSNNRQIVTWALPPDLYTRLNITGNEAAGEYNLQIKYMKNTDEGNYNCSHGLNYKRVKLYIPEAPSSVNVTGPNTEGNRILGTEDKDLTVTCRAVGGNPVPEVTLKGKVDNQVYKTGSQTLEYTFSAISRQLDLKLLICQANSTALITPLSKELQIYLELKPLKPELSHHPPATEHLAPLSVSCTSKGSRPNASIQWTIGNTDITSYSTEQVTNDTSTDTYTVTSTLTYTVNRNHNGQILTCGAVNKVLPGGISTSETVNVIFAPEVTVSNITYIQNDDNRTVTCTAVGNPTTYTYEWIQKSKYGEEIRNWNNLKTGVLTLVNVPVEDRYQDSGEYTCTVSNGVRDIHGQVIESNGTGYVKINGAPVFTEDNREIQFGEIGKSATIEINVYSVPKYTTRKWLKDNNMITASAKYAMSETSAIVNSVFHNKEVMLDGYRLTLTINTLTENDFTGYDLQLSNGIGSENKFSVKLESSGGPQTPSNFTVTDSSSTSVSVQWISGYNGGYTQTFHIEYRKVNSGEWVQHEVFTEPETQIKDKKHVYELTGLQPETMYELRMFSSNERNQSEPTTIITAKTAGKDSQVSVGSIIGGIAGGLAGVIIILVVIVFFRRKKDKGIPSKKFRSSLKPRAKDGLKDNILHESDELKDNILYQSSESQGKTSESNADVRKNKQKLTDCGTEYAEVNKPNAVYAEVDKKTQQKTTKGKKQKDTDKKVKQSKGKRGDKGFNNNPDSEYANSDVPMKNFKDGWKNGVNNEAGDGSSKNPEGLQYADLSFAPQIKGKKAVIHGEDDRTVYSEVDHTRKAPPPPQESEYEVTTIRHGQKK